jgi:hypothetical protein
MTDDAVQHTHRRRQPHRRARRVMSVISGLAAAALLATGCSPDPPQAGVASLGSGAHPNRSASGTNTGTRSALAYSRCMRTHGIKDFPDPNGDGELQLEVHPGSDMDPANATYKAADATCKPLLPAAQKAPAELKAKTLKYAQCMRSHGISDFPDPSADGGLRIQSVPGSDLDPNNPQYKKADAACKKYLPNQGKGGSLSSKGSGDGK